MKYLIGFIVGALFTMWCMWTGAAVYVTYKAVKEPAPLTLGDVSIYQGRK